MPPADPRPPRRASRVATIVVLAVAALAAVGAIALDLALAATGEAPVLSWGWSGVLPGAAMLVPGCLLLWQRAGRAIAVALAGFGLLWVVDGIAAAAVNYAWVADRDAWWAAPSFWFFSRFGAVLLYPIVLLLVLFPTGRLRRGAWGAVSAVALALGLVLPFTFLLAPADALIDDDPTRAAQIAAFEPALPTLPLPPEAWAVLLAIAVPCLSLGIVLGVAVAIGRRVGASAEERAQLRWFVLSGVVFVASLGLFPLLPTALVDVLLSVTIGLVSASVVIAVTRYRLYEIDRLLPWTLVSALLVVAVVAIDVLAVLAVGSAIDDRVAMLLAVVVVTVAYAPLRGRLFALMSRVVSGRRGDPYSVVSTLGDRLEGSADAATQLDHLAAAIAEAFAAPFVRVELDRRDAAPLAAEHGAAPTTDAPARAALRELPIEHDGATIGRVLMQPGPRPVVSARDQRLLGDIVRLAAVSIHRSELGRELQAIRERLVAAREEERSRLRRDLHDGLGPLLGGITLRLETARNLAERDPARSQGILEQAIADQSQVIDEIRRIVHDLRPPALDDLGLVQALRQQAARLSGPGLAIVVQGDAPAELPAAVEVAAYRIASEAMENARRHARATRVDVRLEARSDALALEVVDDGRGIPADAVHGVGLRSARERADELGGVLEIATGDAGTSIRAMLPLAPRDPAPDARPEEETAHAR